MIKRAIISGLHSTGVQVADLRTLPAPVGKHHLKTQGYDAAFHVGAASHDPEAVQIRLFERPGIALSSSLQKEIDKHFTRQELRRVPFPSSARLVPARARETSRMTCSRVSTWLRSVRAGSGSHSTTATRPQLRAAARPVATRRQAVTAHSFEADSAAPPVRLRGRSSRRAGLYRRSMPTSAPSSTARPSGSA
jgi:hypothetical protein